MSRVFLDYDQAALDAQYDQRIWAPNAEAVIAGYARASDAVRARIGEPRTERYGPSAAEELDLYGAGECAFVFVHGGAWTRHTKRASASAAETILAAGAAYVALGFGLAPAVTLEEMVAQVCRGLEWTRSNVAPELVLCGHSSGAHLAACALVRGAPARSALLVSGIYDLAPVRLSARNAYLRLDERAEQALSPMRHAGRIRCPVTVAWGEQESPEFARQSREFAAALAAPVLVAAGRNHFEAIEELADARSPLARAALAQLEQAAQP